MKLLKFISVLNIFFLSFSSAFAQQKSELKVPNSIVIKIVNHRFVPNIIEVPANLSFKLTIENTDETIEEFESDDLKKEKLIQAKKSITLPIKGLASGEYKFYGDFHQKTAQGKIVVK
ncbi:MAG: cupredoxin domain-containing protein [Alphaproteobacteria bacterium]